MTRLLSVSLLLAAGCTGSREPVRSDKPAPAEPATVAAPNLESSPKHESPPNQESDTAQKPDMGDLSVQEPESRTVARQRMVADQMQARDIGNPRILDVMGRVPRHEFVPRPMRPFAYDDTPLGIGHGQTISQPYMVALMTQLTDPRPDHKALDIGTGSGYQAAVLAELVDHVYSIEIVEPLATEAGQRLTKLGYRNIEVRHGDGYAGWPEQAPFDLIIVAAAPDHIPPALIEQLAPGGKLVIPVGELWQRLVLVEKADDGTITQTEVAPVTFVPMTGEAEQQGG